MTTDELEQIGQFLFDHLETHEQLQVLMWFHGKSAGSHSVEAVSSALDFPAPVVADAVRRLCQGNLVREEGSEFRYAPGDASLRSSVDRLAGAYAEDWSAVFQLLSVNAIRRIRTSVMGAFADAFVFKGKK